MLEQIFEFQRGINAALAEQIKLFAAGGGMPALAALLPMGIGFGAVHALMPGHSKSILATYVAGSSASALRAGMTAMMLSFTHVLSAVIIAVFSLPLVSLALTSAGRAPALEAVSRGLLGLIGVWMVWRAVRGIAHHANEGVAVGVMAGLVPCPLTLFVMTFAIARGVPEAGIVFAVAMMGGVGFTLCLIALGAVFFRIRIAGFIANKPAALAFFSRSLEGLAGGLLVLFALITALSGLRSG